MLPTEVGVVLERATRAEILDGPVADIRMLADSFREVWGVNRHLGGMALLERYLRPWLTPETTLADVAAGTGDVALALINWAERQGVRLRVAAVDNHPQVLTIARERAAAREPDLVVVPGDARRLPFADGEFDLAVCNLALHHFAEQEAISVLRELDRVARRGWVAADLERHPLAYLAARLLALAVWRNPITRHDGPLSVRRAYRAAEARALVARAGVRAMVVRHVPFRLAIVSTR